MLVAFFINCCTYFLLKVRNYSNQPKKSGMSCMNAVARMVYSLDVKIASWAAVVEVLDLCA